MTPGGSSCKFRNAVESLVGELMSPQPIDWNELEFQEEVEEYLNNADGIPFITLDELIEALNGVGKIHKAMVKA